MDLYGLNKLPSGGGARHMRELINKWVCCKVLLRQSLQILLVRFLILNRKSQKKNASGTLHRSILVLHAGSLSPLHRQPAWITAKPRRVGKQQAECNKILGIDGKQIPG